MIPVIENSSCVAYVSKIRDGFKMSWAFLLPFLFMVGQEEICKYSSYRRTCTTPFCLCIIYLVENEKSIFLRPSTAMHQTQSLENYEIGQCSGIRCCNNTAPQYDWKSTWAPRMNFLRFFFTSNGYQLNQNHNNRLSVFHPQLSFLAVNKNYLTIGKYPCMWAVFSYLQAYLWRL